MYPLVGADPERRCREPDFSPNSAENQLRKGGANGPPVYDALGFEMDYNLVAKGGRRRRGTKSTDMYAESKRKEEILGVDPMKVSASTLMAGNDRVSRDLNIPYHQVGIEDYEEWQRRGFKVEPGELDPKNRSEAEKARLTRLALGSAFRKGSKRG